LRRSTDEKSHAHPWIRKCWGGMVYTCYRSLIADRRFGLHFPLHTCCFSMFRLLYNSSATKDANWLRSVLVNVRWP
jgi:hypothetical protein